MVSLAAKSALIPHLRRALEQPVGGGVELRVADAHKATALRQTLYALRRSDPEFDPLSMTIRGENNECVWIIHAMPADEPPVDEDSDDELLGDIDL